MAAQYRTYNHAPTRGMPSASTPRRGQMPPQAAAHPNAMLRPQHYEEARMQATQRAKKPTDRNMPDGLEDIVIGEGVAEYKKMRDLERRLDAVMMKKHLDFIGSKPPKSAQKPQKLRLWISNTAENQPWQGSTFDENNTFDFHPAGGEAKYKVKIVGKLLDENDDILKDEEKDKDAMDEDGAAEQKPQVPLPKMSQFFKSIKMEVDRPKGLQPDQTVLLEWKKPAHTNMPNSAPAADFDTLQFERKSDENLQCTITLVRDENPERFLLSKPLADLLDKETATREETINGILDYAKAMELQQDEDKRLIQCDARLKAIFKNDVIRFYDLPKFIGEHILDLPPLKLPYTVHVDAEYQNNPTHTIYDILVPGRDLLYAKKQAIMRNPEFPAALRQLAVMDDQLAAIIQSISESKARYAFFAELSKQPVTFIRKWVASQKKDLEIVMGDSRYGSGEDWVAPEFRRGGKDGVWGTQNVRESVGILVSQKR